MNAAQEVRVKTLKQIHVETADTWAKRALAYRAEAERTDNCEAWKGYDDSRHEALEHAALAEDGGQTVKKIERMMKSRGTRR